MGHDPPSRRDLLRAMVTASGTGAVVSMAGCTGLTGTDTPTEADMTTPTPTEMDTPTPTEATVTPSASVVVDVGRHDEYGDILVDGEGMTLYMLEPDQQGESVCYGDCAEAWPPLTVGSPEAVDSVSAVAAELGTIERDDGTLQVTANGWPLYYFAFDEAPGDASGMGVNNVWFVLQPDGSVLRATVSSAEHDELGEILVDSDGMTLYMLEPDQQGESVCYGDCAEAWPPLTVESDGDLVPAATISTDLGVVERDDGSRQVTANGWPLYYFVGDDEPGDATGQEINNVWFVLRPDGSVLRPTVSVREHDELGNILTDAHGMTLYMFEPDNQGASTCYGDCADAWPPLLIDSPDDIRDSVRADITLGTVERDDGSLQVAANDWPLYYFVRDETPGDAAGQGANDVWWVLRPDGTIVRPNTDDPTPTPTPTPTPGTGY